MYIGTDPITSNQSYKSAAASTMKEAKLKEAQLSIEVASGEIVPKWEHEQPQDHYTFKHYLLKPSFFGDLYFERMTVLDIQKRVNKFIPMLVSSKMILSYAK